MLVQYMILFKRTLRLKQGNFSHLIQLHSFSLKNTYEIKKKSLQWAANSQFKTKLASFYKYIINTKLLATIIIII